MNEWVFRLEKTRNEKVGGSTPLSGTTKSIACKPMITWKPFGLAFRY